MRKNFLFLLVFLLVPAALFWWPLGRASQEKEADFPEFSWSNWSDGTFQAGLNQWTRQHFGLRNGLLRVNNQKNYALFKQVTAKDVVVGRAGYLFEQGYIDAYTGSNYLGQEHFDSQIRKLAVVRDSLKNWGTDVVVVMAAGKASYFPEYLPRGAVAPADGKTNEAALLAALRRWDIHHLDFNTWFRSMKPTTPYPLFSQPGIHWSKYGQYLVQDSLTTYLERLRNVDLPHQILDTITVVREYQSAENDIGRALNLLWPTAHYAMARPQAPWEPRGASPPLKGLVVGDSYYWSIYFDGYSKEVLGNGDYWYYFTEYFRNGAKQGRVSDLDLLSELPQYDVILLWNTETNYGRLGNAFIERLFDILLTSEIGEISPAELAKQVAKIRSTEAWLRALEKKSATRDLSLQEVLESEARYFIRERRKRALERVIERRERE